MRGIKKPSRLLQPLIISASLIFDRSPFFNCQFCTTQQSPLRVQIPGQHEKKKSAAFKPSREAFHVPAAICASAFRSAFRACLNKVNF
jgi:hypothetical protein